MLTERDVVRIMLRGKSQRDRVLLWTIYGAGLKSNEVAQLRKHDVRAHGNGGTLSIFSSRKRARRAVQIPPQLFRALVEILPTEAAARIFGVGDRQIRRIVNDAGQRAGLRDVTPAALRVAHRDHALDRGCPLPIVQRTLGIRPAARTPRLVAAPNESSALYLPK